MTRKRCASTMLITDRGGRVLVVNPTYKPGWELPGGIVEAHESPADAAARETSEELGLALPPGRLLALDYVPTVAGTRTEGLITVYDGGKLLDLAAVVLPPDELSDATLVEPTALGDYLPALQTRRARAALTARETESVAELVDGYPRVEPLT